MKPLNGTLDMHGRPNTYLSVALLLGFVLASAIVTSQASTVLIDFEEPEVPDPGTQVGISDYSEDGFYIKPSGPVDTVSPFRLRRNGGSTPDSPDNGTPFLQLAVGDSFEMTALSGVPFKPISIDLAEFSVAFSGIPVEVTFLGTLSDTSMVSTTFTLDGDIDGTGMMEDFQTFLFPSSFTGLTRLEVSEVTSPIESFSLDRLFVDNVPEPSRVVLMMFALTMSLLPRRRPESIR